MEDIEHRALTTAPVSQSFWKRFVDDVISPVSQDEIVVLLQHLNSIEPSIQFTVERETDGKLPFLDTYVQRTTDGKLETVVYHKPTHTDKYLSFNSHHPRSHKSSVVTTLFQRAENLTSNNDAFGFESALAEHVCETSHNIAWEDSKIITTNNRYGQRLCFGSLAYQCEPLLCLK